MHYLSKIRQTYYFRLRIPQELVLYFGCREVKKSLHTKSYRYAKSLLVNYLSESERVFTMIRSGTLTDEMIKRLAFEYLDYSYTRHEKKVSGELERENPEEEDRYRERREKYFKKIDTPEDEEKYVEYLQGKSKRLQNKYNKRLGHTDKFIQYYVGKYLEKHNLEVDKNSPEYVKICNEFLLSDKRFIETIREHLLGNYETSYDIEKRNKTNNLTLQELIDLYEKERSPEWTDKHRIKGIHRQIIHILGDIPLNEINRTTSLKLSDSLKEYPRGLCISDMNKPWEDLSKKNKNRLSDKTQYFVKSTFSTLIKYAKEQELGIKGNPAKGLAGKKPINENAHLAYTIEELQNIVNALATVNIDKNPEKFWIPLLLMYSGARANEICMLRCEDIEQQNNIWIFKFYNRPEHHQRTKNGKDRQIPVHKQLIKLGFLKYLEQQRKYKKDRLFSNLKLHRDKWNDAFGKYFNRTFRKIYTQGIVDDGSANKDLHSFRKTLISWFIQQKKHSNITDISVLQSIVGHFESANITTTLQFIDDSKLTTNVYGGGYGKIDAQNKLLQSLDYGLDFNKLKGLY